MIAPAQRLSIASHTEPSASWSRISVPVRLDRRKLWISPILNWTALECSDLIAREGFRRNDVVALLHRSGECLCGALARSGEIHDVDAWYPEVGARIHALERACESRGIVSCVWASRESRTLDEGQESLFSKAGMLDLCSSCEARFEETTIA